MENIIIRKYDGKISTLAILELSRSIDNQLERTD